MSDENVPIFDLWLNRKKGNWGIWGEGVSKDLSKAYNMGRDSMREEFMAKFPSDVDAEQVETKFAEQQQELVNAFKKKMLAACEDVMGTFYTDVLCHAVTDAHINFRNYFRDHIAEDFRKEITSKYEHYSWAHSMRMELLKHHKEELQNKIIEDLQGKIVSLEEHIEQMRRFR